MKARERTSIACYLTLLGFGLLLTGALGLRVALLRLVLRSRLVLISTSLLLVLLGQLGSLHCVD